MLEKEVDLEKDAERYSEIIYEVIIYNELKLKYNNNNLEDQSREIEAIE
ncbi:MAG: hypothetical protein ACO2ON_03030 [Candidatus Nanopusillus sp.]